MTQRHPLDNPVWSSLAGPHARFARGRGEVLLYPEDVTPFAGLPAEPAEADWRHLAELAGPGAEVGVMGMTTALPPGWTATPIGSGVQMVHEGTDVITGDVERLGAADVPEMLGLAARAKPGPFLPRTFELGTYLGIRRRGRLVAMAGERLHPPGWTEVSAVCTDDAWRGHGFASVLVGAVATGIRARGETPFLHALASNTTAIRLYEALGFRLRRTTTFTLVRVPEACGKLP
jgi:GNAT superfamily N-acetyltransferase